MRLLSLIPTWSGDIFEAVSAYAHALFAALHGIPPVREGRDDRAYVRLHCLLPPNWNASRFCREGAIRLSTSGKGVNLQDQVELREALETVGYAGRTQTPALSKTLRTLIADAACDAVHELVGDPEKQKAYTKTIRETYATNSGYTKNPMAACLAVRLPPGRRRSVDV
jgi:hypothetical protein